MCITSGVCHSFKKHLLGAAYVQTLNVNVVVGRGRGCQEDKDELDAQSVLKKSS